MPVFLSMSKLEINSKATKRRLLCLLLIWKCTVSFCSNFKFKEVIKNFQDLNSDATITGNQNVLYGKKM